MCVLEYPHPNFLPNMGKFFLGCHTSRRQFASSTYEEKVTFLLFFDPKIPLKSSNMMLEHPESVKMMRCGQSFA